MNENVAWYCQDCGRIEQPPDERYCPDCGKQLQRCSRYEWFLIDALSYLLALSGREFRLIPQYPIRDHRGFNWHFDIFVWVKGNSLYGGYGELIEVNGPNHARQKRYTGSGGGYTRDYDKEWETVSNLRMHKRGIETRTVSNEECTKKGDVVYYTAIAIVDELIQRADTWC
jgi:hypothetical protein